MRSLEFLKKNLEYNDRYYESIFYKKDVCEHYDDYLKLYEAIRNENFWQEFWKRELIGIFGVLGIFIVLGDIGISLSILGAFSLIIQLENYFERKYEFDENIRIINDIIDKWSEKDLKEEIENIKELSFNYQRQIDELCLNESQEMVLRRERK